MIENLLEVRNLSVSFHTDDGIFKAVDNVSFHVKSGEIVGLVGESGCGKSVTSLSILKLIPSPPGKIESGQVYFNGQDVLKLDTADLRKIRGSAISMIFQEPLSALSPLQRVGRQLVEALKLHNNYSKNEAWTLAEQWLEKVKIPDAKERMFAYPFQLSGGMQQRVMIAMAMMLEPDLIIADEPTTALDVTIQAKIFALIKDMRQEKTSILLITHDMGVIWEMCDRVLVMYASRIAEEASKDDIFKQPAHPYTRGLLKSIPKLAVDSDRLAAIPGQVPSPLNYPSGCHFRDRCPHAFDRCAHETPPFMVLSPGHRAACWIADKLVKKY
jgi:peptide/nickel transport system ATP-binding protein/oligopeptide transport system ATP-binding protein